MILKLRSVLQEVLTISLILYAGADGFSKCFELLGWSTVYNVRGVINAIDTESSIGTDDVSLPMPLLAGALPRLRI